jgi:hypothetical protein
MAAGIPASDRASTAALTYRRVCCRFDKSERHRESRGCSLVDEMDRRRAFAGGSFANQAVADLALAGQSLVSSPRPKEISWRSFQCLAECVKCLSCGQPIEKTHALVAQLDRASDFDSEGRRFESFRARHRYQRRIGQPPVPKLCRGNPRETFNGPACRLAILKKIL